MNLKDLEALTTSRLDLIEFDSIPTFYELNVY